MTKKIYIHIGNHKTGSTAIQNFLLYYSNKLKKSQIEYPKIGFSKQYPYNNHNLAWELNDDIRFNPEFKTLSDFYNFLNQCNNNIIISSEDFEYLDFNINKINEFLEVLKNNNYEIIIILFLRNQVDYFSSFYQILLLLGHATNDIKSLWLELKDNDYYKINKIKFWFDYNQQIKQILKTFKIEKKNIICKSYDECKNNLLDNIVKILNIDNNDFEYENFNNINPSITNLSALMLEYFNINKNRYNLNSNDITKITSTLINSNIFKSDKFKFIDDHLITFMKERFFKSNQAVEDDFNIKINNFFPN